MREREVTIVVNMTVPNEAIWDEQDDLVSIRRPSLSEIKRYVREALLGWGKGGDPDGWEFSVMERNPKLWVRVQVRKGEID